MRNPASTQRFLTDPNYYRLGYQLAAQLLNRELALREDEPHYESLSGRGDEPGDDPRVSELFTDPLAIAERLLVDTDSMLAWYRDRLARAKWRPWVRAVQPHEQRLITFVSGTVEPCAHLIAAAVLLERGVTDPERVEGHVDAVMERARGNELSYRGYYGLACWHARLFRASDDRAFLQRALGDLRTALSKASHKRAVELARWAVRDPSLRVVRRSDRPAFNALTGSVLRPERRVPPTEPG